MKMWNHVSQYRLSHHQLKPCSHLVIFGAQRGTMHNCLFSLRRHLAMKIYLWNSTWKISKFWGCISQYGLSHHSGDNVSGSRIVQVVEYSFCKPGIPGSRPGLTAHFSLPVTHVWLFVCYLLWVQIEPHFYMPERISGILCYTPWRPSVRLSVC